MRLSCFFDKTSLVSPYSPKDKIRKLRYHDVREKKL